MSPCGGMGGEQSETAWRESQPTTWAQMGRRFCHTEPSSLPSVSLPINRKEELIPKNWGEGEFPAPLQGIGGGFWFRGWGGISLSLPTYHPSRRAGTFAGGGGMADTPVLTGAVGWALESVGAVGAEDLAAGREREDSPQDGLTPACTHLCQACCGPLQEEMDPQRPILPPSLLGCPLGATSPLQGFTHPAGQDLTFSRWDP